MLRESELPELSQSARLALAESKKLLSGMNAQLEKSGLKEAMSSARKAFDSMKSTLRRVDNTVLQGQEDIIQSLRLLNEGLDNFEEFTRMVKENPSLIFSKSNKIDVIEGVD